MDTENLQWKPDYTTAGLERKQFLDDESIRLKGASTQVAYGDRYVGNLNRSESLPFGEIFYMLNLCLF